MALPTLASEGVRSKSAPGMAVVGALDAAILSNPDILSHHFHVLIERLALQAYHRKTLNWKL
jgi:hypothetical protein